MSAARLREGATAIRDEWGERGDQGTSWHRAVAFHLAVADQLDDMAAVIDAAKGGPLALVAKSIAEKSLAVADAYLGSAS